MPPRPILLPIRRKEGANWGGWLMVSRSVRTRVLAPHGAPNPVAIEALGLAETLERAVELTKHGEEYPAAMGRLVVRAGVVQ